MAAPSLDKETLLYQSEGARFLSTRRQAFLADEPGLGKTVQAIMGCALIGAERVVVLAPASTLLNWEREFEKWLPIVTPTCLSYAANKASGGGGLPKMGSLYP